MSRLTPIKVEINIPNGKRLSIVDKFVKMANDDKDAKKVATFLREQSVKLAEYINKDVYRNYKQVIKSKREIVRAELLNAKFAAQFLREFCYTIRVRRDGKLAEVLIANKDMKMVVSKDADAKSNHE